MKIFKYICYHKLNSGSIVGNNKRDNSYTVYKENFLYFALIFKIYYQKIK